MARIVMKFGGTSVADIARIRNVARHVKREVDAGHDVAVVVSAMAGKTNELVAWCGDASPMHDAREYDAVVASGEQVTSGLLAIALQALGVLVAWLGRHEMELRRDDALQQMYLAAGKQVAVNLTTIDHRHVDDDIKRALDTSTGAYFDDFKQRSAAVVDSVKQQQSVSVGTVTEAGVESATDTSGVVLVAVKVHTEVGSGPPQRDRYWRVRLTMQKEGEGAKVSKVEPIQ